MSLHPEPQIILIAAMAENNVIGRDNTLPWHLPADLKHFKQRTTGHAIIMGRKTFDSIKKPLPNRTNIVITRQPDWSFPGVITTHSIKEAIAAAGDETEVYIVGGSEIYKQALPLANQLSLTFIHESYEGDAYFPEIDFSQWEEIAREEHPAQPLHHANPTNPKDSPPSPAFAFVDYQRIT